MLVGNHGAFVAMDTDGHIGRANVHDMGMVAEEINWRLTVKKDIVFVDGLLVRHL